MLLDIFVTAVALVIILAMMINAYRLSKKIDKERMDEFTKTHDFIINK